MAKWGLEVLNMAQKFQLARAYCKETGFPVRQMMEKLVHCSLAPEFSFRSGGGKTSPIYINVEKFEKMLERGDFKEVLEA